MQTSNTALFFLEDDCIRAFGQETGCTLLQQAEELYQDLCQHGNDRGNHVIEEHLRTGSQNKLPAQRNAGQRIGLL